MEGAEAEEEEGYPEAQAQHQPAVLEELAEEIGGSKLDVDMFLLPIPLGQVSFLSQFWSTHGPPMKVCLRGLGCTNPSSVHLAFFLELPAGAEPQGFKDDVSLLSCNDWHARVDLLSKAFKRHRAPNLQGGSGCYTVQWVARTLLHAQPVSCQGAIVPSKDNLANELPGPDQNDYIDALAKANGLKGQSRTVRGWS